MEKRYQVFVSSTYDDLKVERQEVIQALLELDCIPAGMELFPAADDDQWTLIKKVIDDCDYYILIIGGRYGSLSPDGISYTEKEYLYALEVGKPILTFIHDEPENLPVKLSEKSDAGKKKLEEFKFLVKKKMCKSWKSAAELGSVVSRSMIKLIKTTPAIGWVKAEYMISSEEVLNQKNTIEELRRELEKATTEAPKDAYLLADGADRIKLSFSYRLVNEEYDPFSDHNTEDRTAEFEASWDEIFATVSPGMINETTEEVMINRLNMYARDTNAHILLEKKPGKNAVNFQIHESDFDTVKIQLRALGLIVPSKRQRSVKDAATYWTLTPYGDLAMTKLRAIKKEYNIKKRIKQLRKEAARSAWIEKAVGNYLNLFNIMAKVRLTKKPAWLDDFRSKYDENYDPHITLKTTSYLEGDFEDLQKELANISKKYRPIKVIFNKLFITKTSKGGCIMLEAEHNDQLIELQKEITNTFSKYGRRHVSHEIEQFETNFKPHQTIARHLTPDQLERAKKELGKDLSCEAIIDELGVALTSDDSYKGWSNAEGKSYYKLSNVNQ